MAKQSRTQIMITALGGALGVVGTMAAVVATTTDFEFITFREAIISYLENVYVFWVAIYLLMAVMLGNFLLGLHYSKPAHDDGVGGRESARYLSGIPSGHPLKDH